MKRVVVTGLGAVSPVGNSVPAFWDSLLAGKNGIGFITKFDTTDYKVKIAAEVKDFNPLDFMDKGESRREDAFSQYAIAAALEAVADSGISASGETPNVDPERLGVYVGSGTGGMTTFMDEAKKIIASGPRKTSPFFIPMMIGNMAAGNIAIRFNAQGPSLPVVTACATSTNAVGEAFRAIRYGFADAIIAGGSEATVVELAVAGFTNCMALTTRNEPEACSVPFDKRRDGFVMGEGAGILVLEEYEHAVKRGAKIYAEVTGYGNTCDAHHVTAPRPDALGGARAICQAMAESGFAAARPAEAPFNENALTEIDGSSIYLNAHGTSTPMNDKTETLAIKTALGEEKARKIHMSSTKSMTGHMLGAAGAIEAIATVLALRDGKIPPTIGYVEPDPECDLDCTPNKSVDADVKLGLSVSLGFGGHNGCLAFKKYEG